MQLINKIVLGTAQFGLKYGINNTSGKPTQQEVEEILLYAYRAGIRCLDSAEIYGDAHRVIGNFHKHNPTNIFDVITKLPYHIDGNLEQRIDHYLCQLNVPKLRGLLYHSYDTYKEDKKSLQILNSYKNDGKVEYLGVSIYTNEQMEDVINDEKIDIIQLPFNLFDNINLRGDIIKKAKANGKLIHTRSAFLQGLFFTSLDKESNVNKSLLTELNCIHRLSKLSNISTEKIALNYCLQQENIDQVLIGIDNLNQLINNLNFADYSLAEEIIDEINAIRIKDVNLLNPSLWH